MRTTIVTAFALALLSTSAAWLAVRLRVDWFAALFVAFSWAACLTWVLVHLIRGLKRRHIKVVVTILAVALSIPVFAAVSVAASYFVDSLRLRVFAAQLYEHPPPEGAVLIAKTATIGVLHGNGNHCDYQAEITLAGKLETSGLLRHYRTVAWRPAIVGGAGEPVRVTVSPIAGEPSSFRVVLSDSGYGPNLDLRCA